VFLPIATGIAGRLAAETLYWRTSVRRKNADSCSVACFTLKKNYKSSKTLLLPDLIILVLLPNFSAYFLMHLLWGFLCGKGAKIF